MMHHQSLSIRTPEGQAHERVTERAWGTIMDYFKGCTRKATSDTHSADAIIQRAGAPVALIEIKSRRDFDEQMFWRRHRGEWLITAHKLDANEPIAAALRVPFLGAMHIVQDRVVLLKTIWTPVKGFCEHRRRHVETQARIDAPNSKITRLNAFIPMDDAVRLRY
jgi:hypothetical protein